MINVRMYIPLLNLIGKTEGTDKAECYNAVCGYDVTLGYGAYTDGPVDLTSMTLAEVDQLQTKMLRHPKNKLNSSACGRYQIVRTTLRALKKQLKLSDTVLFDEGTQDQMACHLLVQRGLQRWLDNKLSEDALINNLAKEWASLPNTKGVGHYGGQRAAVKTQEVRDVLSEVRKLYLKPIRKSRTIAGAVVQGAGAAGASVTQVAAENINEAADAIMPLASLSMWITGVFVAMIIAGFALTTYARIDDRKKELR
jgi:muramidase (phage lysozyme)